MIISTRMKSKIGSTILILSLVLTANGFNLDCDFNTDTNCPWIIGPPIKLTSIDSEKYLQFETARLTPGQGEVLAKLESSEISVRETEITNHCTLVITMKMIKFDAGQVKIVRQSTVNSEPDTILMTKQGNNQQRWEKSSLISPAMFNGKCHWRWNDVAMNFA